jgi:3-methyl-2-oxobutanoate hydroxymethyltransferase
MGHVGLRPQAVHQLGGYRMQRDIDRLMADAEAAAQAGACAVVLECVPQEVAARITQSIAVPTIGIGAGPHCDGQVLVMHDLIGLSTGRVPRFVRAYADVKVSIGDALARWRDDVEHRRFPGAEETLG